MEVDALDRVIKNAIDVMESSKYQIFEICESVRSEREALYHELQQVIEETTKTIDQVDQYEVEYRKSRIRLTEVSRDFKRYNEEDIRLAYEAATQMQTQLAMYREKEIHLKHRRDDLQKRLKNVDRQLERAETLVSQLNVVLEYLSGDLNQVTRLLESAKNRQLMGLKIILLLLPSAISLSTSASRRVSGLLSICTYFTPASLETVPPPATPASSK